MSNLVIKNGKILTPSGFYAGNLLIEDGIISKISVEDINSDYKTIDAKRQMVLPGFIDIHTHGAYGVDCNNAKAEDYKKLNIFFASKGVTSYLPTVAGDTYENAINAVKSIKKAMDSGINGSEILGIHLEGPHLSEKHKGAIPEEVFRDPAYDELLEYQKLCDDKILHMTMAPERHGAVEFISKVKKEMPNLSISLGHTGATYERTMDCINNGLSHATHTFNAMKMMHHREPGVMGAIFDSNITAEIIPDGKHVHPAMLRVVYSIKGEDRTVVVTDSAMATGLPDGDYILGRNKIRLTGEDLFLADNDAVRAGSVLTMIGAFKNVIHYFSISIGVASKMLSLNPARVLGIEHKKGSIQPGFHGDVIILSDDFNIENTVVKGKLVY